MNMTETTEEYVGDFAHLLKLRAGLARQSEEIENRKDKVTTYLTDEIAQLRKRLEEAVKPFVAQEDELDKQIARVAEQLRSEWKENSKTHYVEGYIVRRRDLKYIDIKDKAALVESLHKLGKLTDSIKKFDENLLVKLSEVDILSKDVAVIDIKQSISCQRDKRIEKGDMIALDAWKESVAAMQPIINEEKAIEKAFQGMKDPEQAQDTLDKE